MKFYKIGDITFRKRAVNMVSEVESYTLSDKTLRYFFSVNEKTRIYFDSKEIAEKERSAFMESLELDAQ